MKSFNAPESSNLRKQIKSFNGKRAAEKRTIRWLGSIFGVCAVSIMLAQTVYPIPYNCTEQGLRDSCGDDWHICYLLFGCWLVGADASKPVVALPAAAAYPMNRLRVR